MHRTPSLGLRGSVVLVSLILLLNGRHAAAQPVTSQVKVLLDLDNNPSTGCTISTPAGPFNGAEEVVVATFDTASNMVTAEQLQVCSGGILGAPTPINAPFPPPWPMGFGNGVSGSTLIETYLPLSGAPGANQVRAGFVVGSPGADEDALLPAQLFFAAGPAVPTLSEVGLIVLSLGLLLSGFFLLRRHTGALAILGFLALLAGTTGVAWASIGLHGQASDWAGIPPLGTKAASASPTHSEILAAYGASQAGNLYFRVDANVFGSVPPPSPTPTLTPTPTSTPTSSPTPSPTPTPGAGSVVTIDPVAAQTIPTNTTLSLRLVGHSTDILAVLTYSLVSGPQGASVSPLGVFAFAPAQGQLGPQSVTVKVQDQGGRTAQTAFNVMVVDHDHPPVLGSLPDDRASVGVVYTKTLTATDPDPSDTLTFTLLSGPAGMTLTGSTLSWTPTAAQLGNWPVEVKVTDSSGLSAGGLFHVGIAFLTATDDAYSVNLGKTLLVAAPGVLGNDVDPLSGPLTATRLTDPDKGTVTAFGTDGSFTYQAPAVLPGPVFAPVVKYHIDDGGPTFFEYADAPLVADVDGDGKPEIIVHIGFGIRALRGTDGSQLWETAHLPAPFDDCTVAQFTGGNVFHLAVGEVDDSGQLSIVFPTSCGRDNQPTGIIGTNTARYAALNARDGSFKWLSQPLSRELDSAGNPDSLAAGTVPTIARVRFGETPSIVIGNTVSYFLFNGKPECDQLVPGWPANVACRGVFVLDGKDGTVRQRMAAPTAVQYDRTTYGNGTQAAVVADLDGDGNSEFIFGGGVFNNDGSVRSNNTDDSSGHPESFWTGVANFDDTPDIEVARLDGNGSGGGGPIRLAVFKSDGRLLWSAPLSGTPSVGIPVIADVDGTGRPSVVLNVGSDVCAIDYRGTYKWCYDAGTTDGTTPKIPIGIRSQVYDLDGDGVPEVIVPVNPETLLFLDGKTGTLKFTLDMGTLNGPPILARFGDYLSGPVVADVDGSGHASIVSLWDSFGRLDVVGSANNDWRPARRIFNQASYQFGNVNDDGTIPATFVNNFATPATNVFGTQAQVLTPVDPRKRSETVFTYSASDGPLTSAPGDVTIDILPPNRPPVFISKPPTRYIIQSPFSYTAQAIDPDPGDTVTYSLKLGQGNGASGFGNCTMAPSTGVLSCGILFNGEQNFVIVATDSLGASAYQTFQMLESPGLAAVPNVVGQQQAAAGTALTAAGFAAGNVTKIDNPAPAGQVVQQNPGGGTQALLGSSVDLVVSNGPPLPPPPPGPPPSLANIKRIVVTPADTVRVVGDNLPYKATAIYTDNTGADITASATWSSTLPGVANVSASGVAHGVGPGTTVVTAMAGGLSGEGTLTIVARTLGDTVDPVAVIAEPATGAAITGLTQILGTATDANFVRYELALAASGDPTFTLIGQGTISVSNGILGTLDPTLLFNGAYTLRLTVYDGNANTTTAQVPIVVEGGQKVGNFTISYTDLTVPLPGLPIQILRTYDSRDKRSGDFGVGWSLGVKTLRVSASGVLGTAWQVIQLGTSFALVPGTDHFVSVGLPSGQTDTFELVLTPSSSFLVPFTTLQARFVPRLGTLGTLTTLDNANILIADPQPGPITLLDDVTLNTFDPDQFLYTQLDGTQYIVRRTKGVENVKDTNGNQITIGAGGITHSSGLSVVFTRDGGGRITGITDPNGQVQSYVYSPAGDLASHADAVGRTTSYFYDARHGLVRIEDPLGRPTARTEYDDDGRLLSITDAAGNTIHYTHDLPGRQDLVQDALGRTTVFTYDDRGNVNGITDPLGHATALVHDSLDNETSRIDPDGLRVATAYSGILPTSSVIDPGGLALTTSNVLNAQNDPTSITDAAGRVFSFVYDGNRNITQLTAPLGGTVSAVVNGQGQATSVTDALGNKTVSTRDAAGNVTREDILSASSVLLRRRDFTYDAIGRMLSQTLHRTIAGVLTPLTTSYAYDASGRRTTITDAAGGVTHLEYDPLGRQNAAVDVLGRRTTFAYDEVGHRVLTTYPDGTTDAVTYDPVGNVLSETDQAGRTTAYEYDALDRRVKTILPDGSFTQTVYTPGGRVLASIDAKGNRTDFTYDSAGRRTGAALPAVLNGISGPITRPQVSSVLNALGAPTLTTDPIGRQTAYQYDTGAHPIQTTFADGSITHQTFDILGRRTSTIDEEGHTTTLAYDPLGRLAVVSGIGGDATYGYDEAGNLLTQTDALGRTTAFRYDALNRLVRRTYPGGEVEQFSYDAAGNRVAVTNPNGQTTTVAYDVMNRPTRKDFPDGSAVTSDYAADGQRQDVTDARGTTGYSYDSNGRLSSVRYPSGEMIRYTRDANGNLLALTAPAATANYSYDALDRLVQVTSPEGQSQYFYDLAGNRVRLVAPTGIRTDSIYDARNRPTQLVHKTIGGTVLQSFTNTFSLAGRRTQVTELDGSQENYTFDAKGRLISESRTGTGPLSITHAYDAVGNRTQMVQNGTPATYTYDSDDRLLSDGTASYVHDANGNLISRTVGAVTSQYSYDTQDRLVSINDPGGLKQYVYDADGNRVKTITPGATTSFLVEGENNTRLAQVLEERDGAGNLQARYSYGMDMLSMARGVSSSFYHRDVHGSTRLLTDGAGAVSDTYRYEAYGSTVGSTGSTLNPYLYSGERFDAESGLYQLRARSYAPQLGRFLTRDPLSGRPEAPASLHRYAYASGDPVDNSDPTGQESLFEFALGKALDTAIEQSYNFGTVIVNGCNLRQRLDVIGQTVLFGGLAASAVGVAAQYSGLPGKSGFTIGSYNPFPISETSPKKVELTFELPVNVKLSVTQRNNWRRSFSFGTKGLAVAGGPPPFTIHEFEMCGIPVGRIDFKAQVSVNLSSGAGAVSFSVELSALGTFKFEYPLLDVVSGGRSWFGGPAR